MPWQERFEVHSPLRHGGYDSEQPFRNGSEEETGCIREVRMAGASALAVDPIAEGTRGCIAVDSGVVGSPNEAPAVFVETGSVGG